jgi:hypothetical protein
MQFYWHILENVQLDSNRVDNLEALYCTMALLAVEMGGDDIMADLFRLVLDIQVTLNSSQSQSQFYWLQIMCICGGAFVLFICTLKIR